MSITDMYKASMQKDGESLIDFYARLKQERKGGILGTGGLMDVAKEASPEASPETGLGEVKKNTPQCAPGYVWNGTACVPDTRGEGFGPQQKPETLQNQFDLMTGKKIDLAGIAIGSLIPGAQGLIDANRMNNLEVALKGAGYKDAEVEMMKKDERLMGEVLYRDKNLGFKGPYKSERTWSKEGLFDRLGIDPFNMNLSPQERAIQYAQGRAANPGLFGQAMNQAMAAQNNLSYLGTMGSEDSDGMMSGNKYGFNGGVYDLNVNPYTGEARTEEQLAAVQRGLAIASQDSRGEGSPGSGLGNGGSDVSGVGSSDDASVNSGYAG